MTNIYKWLIGSFILLIIMSGCDCKKNTPLSGLQIIEGEWVSYDGVSFNEYWIMKSDSLMEGIGFSLSGEDTLFCESLQLFERNDSVFYRVKHTEATIIVDFFLEQYSKNSWMFINADNDFPQKIHYQLKNDTLLDITISNVSDTRKQKFFMKKSEKTATSSF